MAGVDFEASRVFHGTYLQKNRRDGPRDETGSSDRGVDQHPIDSFVDDIPDK